MTRPREHPGVILQEEFITLMGLDLKSVADALNLTETELNDFINQKSSVSAKLAKSLSATFGTSAKFWLNLQASYDRNLVTS